MKVLVTGATGFIGQRLCEKLIAAGHEIVVLSRDADSAKRRIGLPLTAFDWDPQTSIPPKEAFAGVTGVIHLAGESVAEGRWTRAKRQRILESRTLSTEHLVEGIKQFGAQVGSFVCASAIGYYSERGDEVLDENSPRGEGFLADVCEAWENSAAEADGFTRRVSIRIGMVLGREGALGKLLPIFRLGLGGPIGNGKQWVSWIHVDDLVALFLHCLENESLRGAVNGVAPAPVTNKTFTKALAKSLGVPAIFPVPPFMLKIALGQMSELALKSQRVKPVDALASGFQYRYPTIESAFTEICPNQKKKCEELFRVNQWLPKEVSEVFPFFCDARNLQRITPDWLHFQVLSESDGRIGIGQKIDYRLKVRGIPIRWQSLIEQWSPNEYFVDRQLKGPYKLWHHTHRFYPVKNGTLIVDEVRYEVPGGSVGSLLLGPWIRSDLKKIFNHRREVIEGLYAKQS